MSWRHLRLALCRVAWSWWTDSIRVLHQYSSVLVPQPVLVPSFSAAVLARAGLTYASYLQTIEQMSSDKYETIVTLLLTEVKKKNNLTLLLFSSLSVQALHINITWPWIQCQNRFTCQIPTPEKSTKQNLSLKQRTWPKTQMWWQEQGISAFHLTRATVETAGRHPRPPSTVHEVRQEHVCSTWCWSFVVSFRRWEIQMQLGVQKGAWGDHLSNSKQAKSFHSARSRF